LEQLRRQVGGKFSSQLLRLGHSRASRALLASLSRGSSLVRCKSIHVRTTCELGGIMRRSLFSAFILVLACSRIEAACFDPATLVHSTVSIARDFNEEESKAEPGVIGIRGTAWFLSARSIVTAAHVAEAMHLSAQEWKDV